MRNLFLALVLANLAFAAWHRWFAPVAPDRLTDADLPPIRLVTELDPSEAPPVARTPGVDAAPPAGDADDDFSLAPDIAPPALEPADAGRRCVSVGPFRELSEAANASAKLRATGYEPTQRVGEGDIWVGYWVYIEGIGSRDEADEILARLRDNGVTDPYRIPGEQDGDIISLGVFSEIARAGRLRDQVRQLGYEPAVVDRTRRGTVYWVDILLGAAERLDFEALQTPGRITRLEQRACERSGV